VISKNHGCECIFSEELQKVDLFAYHSLVTTDLQCLQSTQKHYYFLYPLLVDHTMS